MCCVAANWAAIFGVGISVGISELFYVRCNARELSRADKGGSCLGFVYFISEFLQGLVVIIIGIAAVANAGLSGDGQDAAFDFAIAAFVVQADNHIVDKYLASFEVADKDGDRV